MRAWEFIIPLFPCNVNKKSTSVHNICLSAVQHGYYLPNVHCMRSFGRIVCPPRVRRNGENIQVLSVNLAADERRFRLPKRDPVFRAGNRRQSRQRNLIAVPSRSGAEQLESVPMLLREKGYWRNILTSCNVLFYSS